MSPLADLASAAPPAEQKIKVFISYSRKDLAFAERLVGALNARGFEAYLDKKDIAPGEPWQDRLAQLIRAADTVVFVITPDSVASPICAWEVEEAERLAKRIVPVVWRTADHAKVPGRLSRLNYIFFNIGFIRKWRWFEIALRQLVAAIETDIGWIREHTRYGELARTWEQSARADHDILRGNTLAAAEEWLRLRPRSAPEPTELQTAFIARSREVVDQEESAKAEQVLRLRRVTGAGFVAPAHEALAAGVHEKALRYVVAGAILADDPAFQIVRELHGPATRAVIGSRTQAVLEGHEGAVFSAAFSPDGKQIVTASRDKSARVWDAITGREIATLTGHEHEVRSAAFSPDGTRVVTASWDKTARLWDATTGRQLCRSHGEWQLWHGERWLQPGRDAHPYGHARQDRVRLGRRLGAQDSSSRGTQQLYIERRIQPRLCARSDGIPRR